MSSTKVDNYSFLKEELKQDRRFEQLVVGVDTKLLKTLSLHTKYLQSGVATRLQQLMHVGVPMQTILNDNCYKVLTDLPPEEGMDLLNRFVDNVFSNVDTIKMFERALLQDDRQTMKSSVLETLPRKTRKYLGRYFLKYGNTNVKKSFFDERLVSTLAAVKPDRVKSLLKTIFKTDFKRVRNASAFMMSIISKTEFNHHRAPVREDLAI
jgi:Heterogeneous nuclear ribonucleoprotein Q acidic domain